MSGYIFLISMICLALSGHSNSASSTSFMDTNKYDVCANETNTNNQNVSNEKSTESSPFNVFIDKPSLELKKTKETRVFIDTKLTEWSYTVQAEHGTISEKSSNSFVYTRPKDENQKNDVITIKLVDGENKVQHEYMIPLNYIFNPESIVYIDSRIQTF